MAEIFVPPDNPDSYLQTVYQRAFWHALKKHAPSVLEYLRAHGVDAWLERYGLPREPWYQVGVDYLEKPHFVEWRNFWHDATPPKTPRLEDYLKGLGQYEPELYPNPREYDPSTTPASVWRGRVITRIEEYMAAVERAYTEAGWQRVRVKTNPQHAVWLALRLEGYSYGAIADYLELVVEDDTVRKGVRAMADLLKISRVF